MNKRTTIFVSTNKYREQDSVYITLRNQIEQRLHEVTAIPHDTTSGAATPSTTAITNILPEAPTYYTTDGIILYDNNGIRWGRIVNGIPVGDSSFVTTIQINAVLSRINANTFELPSHAQHVSDVWFDDLKAEPSYHYTFIPDSTISTVSSLGSGVIVTAFYLNVDLVI